MLIIPYGPAIYKIVVAIWDLIDDVFNLKVELGHKDPCTYRKEKHVQLELAINYYKKTRNDSRLKHMESKLGTVKSELEKIG